MADVLVKELVVLLDPQKEDTDEETEKKKDELLDENGELNARRPEIDDEEDLIKNIVNLADKVSKTKEGNNQQVKDYLKSKLKKEIAQDVDQIIQETEAEMNAKLEPLERSNAVEKLSETLDYLMKRMEETEDEVNKVNDEISELQEILDVNLEDLENLKKENLKEKIDPLFDKLENAETDVSKIGKEINDIQSLLQKDRQDDLKQDDKKSIKKELREEEEESEDEEKLTVRISGGSSITKISGLKESSTDSRVLQHVQKLIKEKAKKIDTGGRQVEIKFITTNIGDLDKLNLNGDAEDTSLEAQQYQSMVYNLMVGDNDAYEAIDNQRRSEKSYNFNWDESLIKEAEEKLSVVNEEKSVKIEEEEEL